MTRRTRASAENGPFGQELPAGARATRFCASLTRKPHISWDQNKVMNQSDPKSNPFSGIDVRRKRNGSSGLFSVGPTGLSSWKVRSAPNSLSLDPLSTSERRLC